MKNQRGDTQNKAKPYGKPIQTNETFSTADEQIDYVFEHASMGRTRLFLIGNSVGQVGIFWRNGSSYYNRKFEINAKREDRPGVNVGRPQLTGKGQFDKPDGTEGKAFVSKEGNPCLIYWDLDADGWRNATGQVRIKWN